MPSSANKLSSTTSTEVAPTSAKRSSARKAVPADPVLDTPADESVAPTRKKAAKSATSDAPKPRGRKKKADAGDSAVPTIDSDLDCELDIDPAGEPDLDIEELTLQHDGTSKRKPVGPPAVITPDMSLFDYLQKCQPPLDKKLIDIACSKARLSPDLRKDGAQEIRLAWSKIKPDTVRYKPGQIASYAEHVGRTTALHMRRELGSAVRLPGSAFRSRSDGSTYVTPGVLASALDWNQLESWLLLDGEGGAEGMGGSLSLEMDGLVSHLERTGEISTEADAEALTQSSRLAQLEAKKDCMSNNQYNILRLLIEGARIPEIQDELGIKRGILLRELNIAAEQFGERFF